MGWLQKMLLPSCQAALLLLLQHGEQQQQHIRNRAADRDHTAQLKERLASRGHGFWGSLGVQWNRIKGLARRQRIGSIDWLGTDALRSVASSFSSAESVPASVIGVAPSSSSAPHRSLPSAPLVRLLLAHKDSKCFHPPTPSTHIHTAFAAQPCASHQHYARIKPPAHTHSTQDRPVINRLRAPNNVGLPGEAARGRHERHGPPRPRLHPQAERTY
jgi:hypothetical protein